MTSTEKEFYLDFNDTVGIPRCHPAEIIKQDERTILKFSIGTINLPKLSLLDIPCMENNYGELLANDGTLIRIYCGDFENATYNAGDPLPGRFHVKAVIVNGEDKSWKYIDEWYPWVAYDLESIAYQLYYIYEEEHGGILRNTHWRTVLP